MSADRTTLRGIGERVPLTGTPGWIGRSHERRSGIETVADVALGVGTDVVGDHHAASGTGKRQAAPPQAEHLPLVASLLGPHAVAPDQTRRHLVVPGMDVRALRAPHLRIGDAALEGPGLCPPCSPMNETLGPGGYHAMRGDGGITPRIQDGAMIRAGETVRTEGTVGTEDDGDSAEP